MDSTLLIWVKSVLLAFCGYNLTKYIYRYYFHSLSHIPGPWYLTITSLVQTYHQMKGSLPDEILKAHRKYGSIVRIGTNQISVIDPSGPKMIYTNPKFLKSSFTKHLEGIFGTNLFTIIPRDLHSKRRRIVSHAFSQTNLNDMQPTIWNCGVKQLINKLETKATNNDTVNFIDEFHYLTVDVIGALAFGQKFNMINLEKNEFMESINNSTIMMVLHITFPFVKFVKLPFLKRFYDAMDYMREFAKKSVDEKKLSQSETKDIMHYYLNAKDPDTGESLADTDLQSEGTVLLFAGVDSTASSMAMCVYNLIKYPEVYRKVVDEIDRVKPVDDNGEIKPYLWCREHLPYLEGVIYETLRLTPAFPFGVPRVVPEGGATLNDVYLPANSEISLSIYSYQHSEIHFDNPEAFLPERWFNRSDKKLQDSLMAFGKGSRACIGKHLAWMEITMCLIGLLDKFELQDLQPEEKTPQDDKIINFVNFKPSSGRIAARLVSRSN